VRSTSHWTSVTGQAFVVIGTIVALLRYAESGVRLVQVVSTCYMVARHERECCCCPPHLLFTSAHERLAGFTRNTCL